MKKLFLAIAFLLFFGVSFSQSALPKGRAQLNAGVGFSSHGIPLYIGFDYAVHRDVTIGAEFSFRAYNEDHKDHEYHHNVLGFTGNANYHFNTILNIPQNWDFYAGLNLGFYVWNSPDDYDGDHVSGLGLGAQIGGRYYFSDSFGLNLEFVAGNAYSGGKFGVSFRF